MKKDFRFLKVGNKAIVLKDGDVWVVLYANETKSQEFETEAEARAFASKVGNESIDKQEWSLYKGLKKDAEKEIGNAKYDVAYQGSVDGRTEQYFYVYDYEKDPGAHNPIKKFKTKQEAREYIKKVGNETPEEMEVKYKGYTITYFPYQKKYMVRHPNEVSGLMQKHFTSVDEAKKAIDKKSVGNADTVSEYNAEIQRLTKKAEQLRRMGQGKSAMEIEKQIEKLGKELHELGNKKTGNAKVDWSKVTDKYIDKNGHEVVIQKKEDGYYITNLRNGKEIFAPDRYSAIGIMEKNGSRVENEETKAERKFGKVMGEFEEGALKTPQGKTVTDPAQAKAIAYSEADKVDNLKRARNAMNKKTGNADVTLWKGNDSAYIKGDGTVQYLENNAFETDKDKFESQEVAIRELAKKGYIKK